MMRLFSDLTNIGVRNGSLLRITELRSSEQLLWTSTSKTVKDAPLWLKWTKTDSHLEPLIINICMTTKKIQDIRKVQNKFFSILDGDSSQEYDKYWVQNLRYLIVYIIMIKYVQNVLLKIFIDHFLDKKSSQSSSTTPFPRISWNGFRMNGLKTN